MVCCFSVKFRTPRLCLHGALTLCRGQEITSNKSLEISHSDRKCFTGYILVCLGTAAARDRWIWILLEVIEMENDPGRGQAV